MGDRRILERHAGRVVLSNPLLTRAIAHAKVKTDAIDAATLAELLAADYLPTVWQPDPATRAIRRRVAGRTALVAERTRIRNRISAEKAVPVRHTACTRVYAVDPWGAVGLLWRRGRRAMAAEVMLVGVAKVALEEGAKFLYDQAGKVLDAWRARRRDPAAPLPALVPAPAEVMIGPAQPSGAKPHGDTVLTLEDLRADVEQITTGQLSADDPAARATIAALREVVEAALGASIMFAGEAARPVLGSDINVVVNDVRGRLAGVRLTAGQGGDVTKVRIQAHDVVGGDIVGVDIGGGRPDPAPQPKPERPIRILFLAANPLDTEPLRLEEEMWAIDEALRKSEYRDRFEIRQQWAVRVGDLQEALLRHRPDIVHFSGHGSETNEIVLEDDTGASRVVPQDALARLFSVLRGDIRCVVLNACYSETQAQAIAETIDCVVGMTSAVGDDAAIDFATAFYRALGYGVSVQTAFELGTNQIALAGLPYVDIPHLVAKKADAADVSFAGDRVDLRTPSPKSSPNGVTLHTSRGGLGSQLEVSSHPSARGRRAMAAEVMLVGVAKVALEEGAKFLYDQAGKVLDAWRAGAGIRRPGSLPLVPAPPKAT